MTAAKSLSDEQMGAIAAAAELHGARAFPVWEWDGRICEMAIWQAGECVGNVRLAGSVGRLEAWSSLGSRWWKAGDLPQAVTVAVQGTEYRGFRKAQTRVDGVGGGGPLPDIGEEATAALARLGVAPSGADPPGAPCFRATSPRGAPPEPHVAGRDLGDVTHPQRVRS